jgi:hypothetical protein
MLAGSGQAGRVPGVSAIEAATDRGPTVECGLAAGPERESEQGEGPVARTVDLTGPFDSHCKKLIIDDCLEVARLPQCAPAYCF